ncbi:TPA: Ig-like domain-containing protein, partial [Bacillus cereus]
IVDVLPGKVNRVYAEETQTSPSSSYTIMDASNNWSGLEPSKGASYQEKQNMGDFVRFKTERGLVISVSMDGDSSGAPVTTVEAKVRYGPTGTVGGNNHPYIGTMGFFNLRYITSSGTWRTTYANHLSQQNLPIDEKPKAGEWVTWKATYNKSQDLTTYYLNGKMIYKDAGYTLKNRDSTLNFQVLHADVDTTSSAMPAKYIDVEHVLTSNTITDFVLAPKVNQVTDADTKITGTGKPGATVMVEVDGVSGKYKGTADEQGNFSIDIPKQKADAKLTVTQSAEGTTSEKTV